MKDLWLRSDPYNTKIDLLGNARAVKRNVILAITLWLKQQPSNVLLLEEYLKLEETVYVKRKI